MSPLRPGDVSLLPPRLNDMQAMTSLLEYCWSVLVSFVLYWFPPFCTVCLLYVYLFPSFCTGFLRSVLFAFYIYVYLFPSFCTGFLRSVLVAFHIYVYLFPSFATGCLRSVLS